MQRVNQNLSFLEKRELLEKYRSDLRKVDFERNNLAQIIARLEKELHLPAGAATEDAPATRTAAVSAPKAPRAYTKSSSENTAQKQETYGIKLSDWDVLMLNTLETITEPLNSGALLEIFEAANADLPKPLDEKQLRNALSRTVHKLANKKDIVLKENFPGKGFLYTLNQNYTK